MQWQGRILIWRYIWRYMVLRTHDVKSCLRETPRGGVSRKQLCPNLCV